MQKQGAFEEEIWRIAEKPAKQQKAETERQSVNVKALKDDTNVQEQSMCGQVVMPSATTKKKEKIQKHNNSNGADSTPPQRRVANKNNLLTLAQSLTQNATNIHSAPRSTAPQ